MTERKFQPGIVGKTNVVEGAVIDDSVFDEYEQIVNYLMLYDNGDECTALTGGWSKGGFNRGSGTITKNANNLTVKGSGVSSTATVMTNNKVDLRGYYTLSVFGTMSASSNAGVARYCYNARTVHSSWNSSYHTTMNTQCYPGLTADSYGSGEYATIVAYAVCATKNDDYNTLCEIAEVSTFSSLASLLADSTAISKILSKKKAVKYMVAQCTGNFMVEFVKNNSCLSLLDSSPYKSVVQANPHWAKFLAMVA